MWSYVVRTTLQATTLQPLHMLLQHRSIAVCPGCKAAVQLGRKVTPAFHPQPSPFAVRFGCKVAARSRAQIDSNQYVTKDMVPADLPGLGELAAQPDVMCRGGSVIVSPLGEVIAGPLYDQEGILYADLDMGEIVRGKLDFDVTGHYARPDVFQFTVNSDI